MGFREVSVVEIREMAAALAEEPVVAATPPTRRRRLRAVTSQSERKP
jgi:hypothetical protein